MSQLSLEEIEFIKILATSDATVLQAGMNDSTRKRLDEQIGSILREYYHENTTLIGNKRIKEFEKAGISEDYGKAAIACARRLGIDIS
jgi:hypothetical protein